MNTFKIFAPMLKASMDGDRMMLHGIASSTVKDRQGHVMLTSALDDMERSANNHLTIFLNHEYQVPEDVAGYVDRALLRSHPMDPSIKDLSMDIVVNQSNPRAVKAWEAIDGGTQLGLSIGAMIPDGGASRDRKTGTYQIEHVELLETSLVGVPANPRSWVEYAVKSLNVSWADPDAPAGLGVRSDGEVGQVVEYAAEEATEIVKELDAETLEHADDPPEDGEADPEVVETPSEGDAPGEPVLASTTTTSSGATATFTVAPPITNATVNIKTPYADVSIDTGRGSQKAPASGSSQEALASAPETEDGDEDESLPVNPWAAIGLSSAPTETEEVESALQILEPTVVASLRTSSDLLKAITRELITTKKDLDDAITERDRAIEVTEKVIKNTAEILGRLSRTPVGRRATVRQANEQFESLKSVYGEEFLILLKKGQ